jgi:hypothetical protein
MEHKGDNQRERGNVPILAAMMLIFLIGAGLAYMKWAADEGVENRYERAAVQAHYLAQTGISEQGIAYLRSLEPTNLPRGRVGLASGGIPNVGQYVDTYVLRNIQTGPSNIFRQTSFYTIYSTGLVRFENNKGEDIEVRRTHSLLIQLRSFVNYMYLTDMETTIFGEVIKFWSPDTLYGRVHSNDQIAIRERPVFYGPVTTCADDFWHGPGYNPYFEILPEFNVPAVLVPDEATKVRQCAASSGHWYDGQGIYNHRLVFYGDGGWRIYRWEIGTPYNDSLLTQGPPIYETAMFFVGPLELKGRVLGTVTVGASEDIRLIDNIWYVDSGSGAQPDSNSTNLLGIVSEGSIIVADTWENGRYNSQQGMDIFINAGMVALGESFTFEDQNDVWELYQGPYPDERGSIRLWGSVVQKRRGYVHRSNHGGTGYGKDYHYDDRFNITPPPCYPDATDELGHSLFNIVAWGN